MNDEHSSVIDMYDVNAEPEQHSGKPQYKACEIDRTQTRQLQIRIYHGQEEGETMLPYSMIVKAKHRPLVRLLVDDRLPDALSQEDMEYIPLREKVKQKAMMEINALETSIISLPLLEQIDVIQTKIGMIEQLLLFDTNAIHIIEGRHLDQILEPMQDGYIRHLYCYSEEEYEPPQNGEAIIVRVSEYEFNTDASTTQMNENQAE